ncbi:Uu.00g060480.m01.CDS01 [Anthostomella pinea]|uniref:Uu.00g060480.m01.CDS01 n=1 Tax=Anthostomella pinea TaxID=933095 RepID=A0AAI8VSB9_9PEZI|nr:Uu.00g060480.m01.CDS01 [Anthostomella pinea]
MATFASLPTELRLQIWHHALHEETRSRLILILDGGDTIRLVPYKKLLSPSLSVSRQSRSGVAPVQHVRMQRDVAANTIHNLSTKFADFADKRYSLLRSPAGRLRPDPDSHDLWLGDLPGVSHSPHSAWKTPANIRVRLLETLAVCLGAQTTDGLRGGLRASGSELLQLLREAH